MACIMITWGMMSMCKGAVQDFSGLMVCRALSGLAEAGFLSGVLYHLSFCYPTQRLSLRLALLFAFAQLAGTLSGLLAYAISFLNGKAGIAGWRYLFILEGIPTVFCGILIFHFLPNYPDQTSLLTEQERRSVLANLPESQPSSKDKTLDWQQIKTVLTDPTTYTFYLMWACHTIGAKGVFTVLPTVIHQLGLTGTAVSQLMTMPQYVFGAISLTLVAWFVRLGKLKAWAAAITLEAFGCACYIVLIIVEHPVAKYVLIVLATTTAISTFPVLWPERIRAAHGATATGLAIGITGSAAQLHGLIGPHIYQKAFGPTYRISFLVSVGLLVCALITISVTWVIIRRRDASRVEENRKRDVELEEALRIVSGV